MPRVPAGPQQVHPGGGGPGVPRGDGSIHHLPYVSPHGGSQPHGGDHSRANWSAGRYLPY